MKTQRKVIKEHTHSFDIVHPYASSKKTNKSLKEILKPTIVPFEISSIINGSPK